MPALICCLLLQLLAQPVMARVITSVEHWQGEVRIDEPVRVDADGQLIIAPNTQVIASASLEVAGRLQATDVTFSGVNWPGIVLKGADLETVLTRCRVSGATTGISVIGGAPRLSKLVLEKNRVGIELRQKSSALVEDSLFRENTRVGLFLKDDVSAVVRGNRFEQQGKFGVYIYRSQPEVFRDNRFELNPTGLMISHFGSDPLIEKNIFRNNRTGVLVDRTAKPQLRGNLFEDNEIGIDLYRRSDPHILKNRLSKNRQAIRIRYSSYPRIEQNDFIANESALVLAFQSSRWETQKGQAARQKQVGAVGAFGGKNQKQVSEDQRRAKGLDGTVDARNNWWGEPETRLLESAPADANLVWILDGRDTPTFEEGGQTYPLDRVRWLPFSPHAWTDGVLK